MDGRTAEEVIAGAVAATHDESAFPVHPSVWARDATAILAALADAGLVVCGDGEANRAGEKVRVEPMGAPFPLFSTDTPQPLYRLERETNG